MTDKEIAQWVRGWMDNHPNCKELNSMYEDFIRFIRFTPPYKLIGKLTELIWKIDPLKYMSYIPKCMFFDCKNITNIIIPNNIKSISDDAFAYCDSLTEINFAGTKSQWNSVKLLRQWNRYSGIEYIKCIDGIITL